MYGIPENSLKKKTLILRSNYENGLTLRRKQNEIKSD